MSAYKFNLNQYNMEAPNIYSRTPAIDTVYLPYYPAPCNIPRDPACRGYNQPSCVRPVTLPARVVRYPQRK